MGPRETLKKVKEAILPVLSRRGLQLVDMEFVREHQGRVLRIFLDKEGGITLDDCSDVSGEMGDVLDVADIIGERYHLEISSPGLDRRVRDPLDFNRFAGRMIKVKMTDPVEGRRAFSGVLLGMEGESAAVEVDGRKFLLPLESIEKANLKYEWEEDEKNKPGSKE
jgi:ribosome maturation factor RimP